MPTARVPLGGTARSAQGAPVTANFIVGGVVVSPVVVQLGLALLLTMLVSFVLLRIGFYRLVWHRPLVEAAIFCICFGTLVVLSPER